MLLTRLTSFLFNSNYQRNWQIVFWLNAILLLYLTLSPASNIGITIQHTDKLFHFIGFGAFTFFLYLGFPRIDWIRVLIMSFLLGIAVEVAQSYIPYRSFDTIDMLADFFGSIMAVLFLQLLKLLAER